MSCLQAQCSAVWQCLMNEWQKAKWMLITANSLIRNVRSRALFGVKMGNGRYSVHTPIYASLPIYVQAPGSFHTRGS